MITFIHPEYFESTERKINPTPRREGKHSPTWTTRRRCRSNQEAVGMPDHRTLLARMRCVELVVGGNDRGRDREGREVEDGKNIEFQHPVDHVYTQAENRTTTTRMRASRHRLQLLSWVICVRGEGCPPYTSIYSTKQVWVRERSPQKVASDELQW